MKKLALGLLIVLAMASGACAQCVGGISKCPPIVPPIGSDDQFIVNQVNPSAPTGYTTRRATGAQVQSFLTALSASTPIFGGTNGLCLYDNGGFVGFIMCGGGVNSGATTSGCMLGSVIWTDPTTNNVVCDGSVSIGPGFIGSKITAFNGSLAFLNVFTVTSTNFGTPPTHTGTCSVTLSASSTPASGDFTANAPCSGGSVVIDPGLSSTAGYSCNASNLTTPSNTVAPTLPLDPAHVHLLATLSMGDVVTYFCVGH